MKKRSDGRYQKKVTVGVRPDGKPITKFFYGATIKEVDRKYREYMHLLDRGVVLSNQTITVAQLAHEWLENCKKPTLKYQTYRNTSYMLEAMSKYIGHIRVKDLTRYDVERMRDLEIQAGRYDQYNKILRYLRSMLDYAIAHDIVARNITAGLPALKYDTKKRRALTPFEIQAIKAADLDPWERAFVDVLFYAGLRKGEALALTVQDVDLRARTISVSKTLVNTKDVVQDTAKTEAGNRIVTIPEALVESLSTYLSSMTFGPLFPSARDGKYISVRSFLLRWKAIKTKIFGDQAPEDFTPHLFRHNYASLLYRAGVDLKTAQYLLGHSDVKTTLDTYTHFGHEDVNIDKLDAYLGSQKVVKAAARTS